MVATWNPAASAGYYVQQAAYYLGGVEPPGRWYAPGADLGIRDNSEVDRAIFERLFAGLEVDGKPLATQGGGKGGRVPAFDITLSAPRSVSLVWAFADLEIKAALAAAQARATRQTLDLLTREAAWARRGKNGAWVERVALTAATFQHGESRPATHMDGQVFADPNLHTHCVILNLATRTDGTVGALHSAVLRDWKMTAGAVYHAALAAELQALGFSIDRIGKNGIFEIAGIDDAAIQYFSARRAEIEQELAERGTTSDQSVALAAAVTKLSRKAKNNAVPERREDIWHKAARANGLDCAGHPPIDREPPNILASEALARERLADLPSRLTEMESVIDRRELFRSVATALVGTGFGPDRLDAEIDRLLREGHIVELGQDAVGQKRYSTPEMMRIERELIASASQLARDGAPAPGPESVRAKCLAAGLSAEQMSAALAATSSARLAIIEGAPGTGKTTTLAPIVAGWREAGYKVIGAATAWRIANMLQTDLAIEARATASWLERARQGRNFLHAKTLLIVDEAGLLSSREMHAILTEVERSGARLILVGDPGQLQAIGAGPGLKLAARAIAAAKVETIHRQREPWLRAAVTALGAGRAAPALTAFAEHDMWVETHGARAAIEAIADRWIDARHDHPAGSILLIAKTNAETRAIGQAIRARLREQGHLHGPEVAVDTVTPAGHAARIALAAGDSIRFLARHDGLGVINGTVATIVRIQADGASPRIDAADIRIEANLGGRRIIFSPADLADDKGRARLTWAYASTIYGAQGLTVDRGIVLLTPAFDRHDIYVAASRARDSTVLVSDRWGLDRQILAEQGVFAPTAANAIEPDTRQDWLAKRLDRVHVKESTFDVTGGNWHEGTDPAFDRMSAKPPLERQLALTPPEGPQRVLGAGHERQ